MVLLSPGVAAVVFALTRVEGRGGFVRAEVLIPLLALVAGFVAWALRRGAAALVDVRLLGNRPLASASTLSLLAGGALYGVMLLLPLYRQQVRGADALTTGLLLIPQGVGALLSRSLAGALTDRLGARPVALTGFAVMCAATLPFAFVTADTSDVLLMAALLVRGFGLGAVTIPLASVAYVGLARDDIPHASIITRVAQQLGGSLGTATLVVVLQHAVSGATTAEGVAQAFDRTFWWATAFTALAIPLCLLLPGRAAPAPEPVVVAAEDNTVP